jgi:hypothetical protein
MDENSDLLQKIVNYESKKFKTLALENKIYSFEFCSLTVKETPVIILIRSFWTIFCYFFQRDLAP